MDKCALTCPGCSSRALIACHRHWRTDKSTGLHPKSKTLRATSDQLCPTRPSHRPKVNSTLRASPFAPIPISSTIRSGGISPSTPPNSGPDLAQSITRTTGIPFSLASFHTFISLDHSSMPRKQEGPGSITDGLPLANKNQAMSIILDRLENLADKRYSAVNGRRTMALVDLRF